MRSDGDVAHWEKIVFRVIVGIGVYLPGGDENEGGVDVDGELDVSIFVSIQLEFCLLLGGLVKGLVFLFLVLHLLFYYLVNLTQPLSSREHLRLTQLQRRHRHNTHLVYLRQQ